MATFLRPTTDSCAPERLFPLGVVLRTANLFDDDTTIRGFNRRIRILPITDTGLQGLGRYLLLSKDPSAQWEDLR